MQTLEKVQMAKEERQQQQQQQLQQQQQQQQQLQGKNLPLSDKN